MSRKTVFALFLMVPLMAACSGNNEEDSTLESYNRSMFAFNEVVDNILLEPVAKGYRYVTPEPVRDRIGNAFDNLGEPITFANALLQGDVDHAVKTFWRFILNSTVGIVGLNDVAATAGLPARDEDFGQTLAVWGVGQGDYIVLPILGPSTTRDVFGRVADIFLDPFTYYLESDDAIIKAAANGIVERERLIDPIEDIYATSLDPYSSFKSIYLQRRDAAIRNQVTDEVPALQLN